MRKAYLYFLRLIFSGKGGYVIGMLIDAKTLDEAENLEIVGNS